MASQVSGKVNTGHLPIPKECLSDSDASDRCNEFFVQKVISLRENFTSKPATKVNTFTGPSFRFHNIGAATLRRTLNTL